MSLIKKVLLVKLFLESEYLINLFISFLPKSGN